MEEQRRFLGAYVQHNPPLQSRPSATPRQSSTVGPSSSVSAFVLDSRAPTAQYADEERERENLLESHIQRLQRETRLWRVANSAQWVAWGIVQAKVSGMEDGVRTIEHDSTTGTCENKGQLQANGMLDSYPLKAGIAGLVADAHNKRPEDSEVAEEEHGGDEEQFD